MIRNNQNTVGMDNRAQAFQILSDPAHILTHALNNLKKKSISLL